MYHDVPDVYHEFRDVFFSELSDRDLEFVVEAVMESSLDDVKSRLVETCGIAME